MLNIKPTYVMSAEYTDNSLIFTRENKHGKITLKYLKPLAVAPAGWLQFAHSVLNKNDDMIRLYGKTYISYHSLTDMVTFSLISPMDEIVYTVAASKSVHALLTAANMLSGDNNGENYKVY